MTGGLHLGVVPAALAEQKDYRDSLMQMGAEQMAKDRERIRRLEDALLRCIREIPTNHIPGGVYTDAQTALGERYFSVIGERP